VWKIDRIPKFTGVGRIDEKTTLSRNNLMCSGTPYDPYLGQMTHILTYQSVSDEAVVTERVFPRLAELTARICVSPK
jgi:hypothetical protein